MTRALVTFYDAHGNVVCRLYRNGDGFPWIFGVRLAELIEKDFNFDNQPNGPELECKVANWVADLVSEFPTDTLLIAEDIGWGEDFRYDIHPDTEETLITVSYETLDHGRKSVTITPQGYIDGINWLENGNRWHGFDDNQQAFEHVFPVITKLKE